MRHSTLLLTCLLSATSTLAGPSGKTSPKTAPKAAPKALPAPCQASAGNLERSAWPQGTLLWGMAWPQGAQLSGASLQDTPPQRLARETSSVLRSVELGAASLSHGQLTGASRFVGHASDGQEVKVAVCGSEPTRGTASAPWYRIEIWNANKAAWENPCLGTARSPEGRALALAGVWDETGAHHDEPQRFTFACDAGALAKCVDRGYQPWATRDGQSLAGLHQACTRMLRADYCGNGQSHTRDNHIIDLYDSLGINTRTRTHSAGWSPERASVEAQWGADGAVLLARTRHGEPLASILEECPGRFAPKHEERGDGDTFEYAVPGADTEGAWLRDRTYGPDTSAHKGR